MLNEEWTRAYQELASEIRSPEFPGREVFDANVENWKALYEDDDSGLTVKQFLQARLAAVVRLSSDLGPARIIRRGPEAKLDIGELMRSLANRRPVFHSEADFQLALGWHINSQMPEAQVRLEKPFDLDGKRVRIDIWLAGEGIAIELKYFTQELSACLHGELFDLKEHAATDVVRHGFLQDVQRLEGIVRDGNQSGRKGIAVLLTNAPGLWNPPSGKYIPNDIAFRLHEGSVVTGRLQWRKNGALLNDDELHLSGRYSMHWQEYSKPSCDSGEFRFLAVVVR